MTLFNAGLTRISIIVLLNLLIFPFFSIAGSPGDPAKKAAAIHHAVLTIDSHTDTPLQMMQKGFDMAVNHDARKEYSKIDFPRMKEGGLFNE